MRALSLWQPWASAIASGAKTIETRSWSTDYRGPLAIHAAKRCVKAELAVLLEDPVWRGALAAGESETTDYLLSTLPFGAIVATCRLVECFPTAAFAPELLGELQGRPRRAGEVPNTWTERDLGDFSAGRFGWVLRDIRPLEQPLPCRGQRGLFHVDSNLLLPFMRGN